MVVKDVADSVLESLTQTQQTVREKFFTVVALVFYEFETAAVAGVTKLKACSRFD